MHHPPRSRQRSLTLTLLLALAGCGAPRVTPTDTASTPRPPVTAAAPIEAPPVTKVEADDKAPIALIEANELVAAPPPAPKDESREAEAPAASPEPSKEKAGNGSRQRKRLARDTSVSDLLLSPYNPGAASKHKSVGASQGYGAGRAALGGLGAVGVGSGGGGVAAGPLAMQSPAPELNTEGYAHREDNAFQQVADKPLSTFSIDVDTASYANVRRFLNQGQRPPADAVRIEELINYFDYDYPAPSSDTPFSVFSEVATAPWNPQHRLLHIGLQGRVIEQANVPARNLVFLLDVSGSMESPDKLPLLVRGLSMLTQDLRAQDRIAMVVYAGASGLVLPPTSGAHKGRILEALQQLSAGGSTNGADGIQLAYRVARDTFVKGGINRVILATDGDFNVGVTSEGELTRLIEKERASGVFLTVLGFGTGNVKDSTMELLADKGNGNYAYIDSDAEAHKVLVREAGSTLVTIAKDVKLQVEFNPARVASYRLIGYENRVLADRDFNDDKKDAGEIGAGHSVTALYEVVLRAASPEAPTGAPEVDPLRYQHDRALKDTAATDEIATLKLRFKAPDGDTSQLRSSAIRDTGLVLEQAGTNFRFAAAVAGFGMLLRGSEARGAADLSALRILAQGALGTDPHGDRAQLLQLMHAAAKLGVDG